MDITIRNSDPRPIYEQIRDPIRKAIISGELKAGEPLPSIRALARDLRISVITTRRAYEELEQEGYIHTVAGKGCFVAELNRSLARESELVELEGQLRQAVRTAKLAGLSREALLDMLGDMFGEDE